MALGATRPEICIPNMAKCEHSPGIDGIDTCQVHESKYTLPRTNMEVENVPLDENFHVREF